MNTLPSSSSKIVVDKFVVSPKVLFLNRPEPRVLRSHKVADFGFFHSIYVQHRAIHPVVARLSSETQAGLETEETEIQETDPSKSVHVKFQLQKECMFGEQFLMVGDDTMFGLWDPSSAIPLNWSDGHVWTVELDIPIGKAIHFKFILKGSTGNIFWQPGPDRIFQTWETRNTITVCEDWDNAQLQKIIEEEQFADQNEQPTVDSEILIVAENFSHPKEELESAIADINTSPAEISIAEPQKEQIVADNIAPSPENPKAIVADNISYFDEDPNMNASSKVFSETTISDPKEEFVAIPYKSAVIAEDILGSKGRPPTVKNLINTDIEGNLSNHVGGPVLVPGLTPLSRVPAEEANKDESEKRFAEDGSDATHEAKNHDMQEANQDESEQRIVVDAPLGAYKAEDHIVPELEEKQEQDGDHPLQLAPREIFSDEEEQLVNGFEQKLHVPKREEQPHPELIDNKVLQRDIQWGRNTLQKLLTSLGLL
ncbi:hypothetical protein FH972_017222 [Carpinus fangiana]|uniref:CBM20 domain-containing protein n=1 Tax=Carpinus fangiana TaxID=176857 RepID=A0A5N6RKC9_9ROSI|nr:hypothetical protein FH972_017221 [Carpinus fangiana]KAE8099225.1 hypothetical protein FH972_017222 [Carpinus fangiana]